MYSTTDTSKPELDHEIDVEYECPKSSKPMKRFSQIKSIMQKEKPKTVISKIGQKSSRNFIKSILSDSDVINEEFKFNQSLDLAEHFEIKQKHASNKYDLLPWEIKKSNCKILIFSRKV